MVTPRRLPVCALAVTLACSHELPPSPHAGWTVRYAHRLGLGVAAPRSTLPDVTLALLDGLRRLGTPRLADLIRRTAGLPLLWDVVITNARADGREDQGESVFRAAEIGNAPAAL